MVRTRELTASALKTLAIICMTLDHVVTLTLPAASIPAMLLHIPGRVVAPIMCYFVAEGYFHTSNLYRYAMRLLGFVALSHFPYVLCFGLPWWKNTSVMWGLFLGLLALAAVQDPELKMWQRLGAVALCCLAAVPADWGYISVLWIVCFGLFRGRFAEQAVSFAAIAILLHILPLFVAIGWRCIYQFGVLLALPLLSLYHGARGATPHTGLGRYAFYIYYPAHLLLLYFAFRFPLL